MSRRWLAVWVAAVVATNGLALLAYAQEKAPPHKRGAADRAPTREVASPPPTVPAPPPPTAGAARAVADDAEPIEAVEQVELVEPVAAAAPKPGSADTGNALVKLIGRLHPLLVHFPIAWIVLLVLVDLATFLLRRPWQTFGMLVGVGTALAVIPVVGTGFLRMGAMGASGELLELLVEHRNLALLASTLVLVAVGLRGARRNELTNWSRAVYMILVVAAAVLVAIAAHHGGMAVYGKDYFSVGG
jgi:uncharacterized membrane protein